MGMFTSGSPLPYPSEGFIGKADAHKAAKSVQPVETKKSILKEAEEVIYGDREQTYGHPAKNLNLIAEYWSSHLNTKITADDVCIMMALLKLARLKNQPSHRDSKVDTCGYMALMERCQEHVTRDSYKAGFEYPNIPKA